MRERCEGEGVEEVMVQKVNKQSIANLICHQETRYGFRVWEEDFPVHVSLPTFGLFESTPVSEVKDDQASRCFLIVGPGHCSGIVLACYVPHLQRV